MATELMLTKLPDGRLMPIDQAGIDYLRKVKAGKLIRCTVVQVRNYLFHKKFFLMLNTIYENWEPPVCEWAGVKAEKDVETFREELTILAGFHHVVVSIRGEARVRADSISFANMDQDTFDRFYSAVFRKGWELLMRQSPAWTEERLNSVIGQMEEYV